jgi:hypothetical protein
MEWTVAWPDEDTRTCICVSDGEEAAYTTDTDDLDAALQDYCATYRCLSDDWQGVLDVAQWRDGVVIAEGAVAVEADPGGGIRRPEER